MAIARQKETEAQQTATAVRRENIQQFFKSQTGRMTFQQAVARWGTPRTALPIGDTLTVMWREEGQGPGVVFVPPGSPFGFYGSSSYGWQLDLIFDRQTQILKSSRYREW